MKKTLTLLFAAASMAMAAEPVLTLSNIEGSGMLNYEFSGLEASGKTPINNNTTVAITLNVSAMTVGGVELFSLQGLSSYGVDGQSEGQGYKQGAQWTSKLKLVAGATKSLGDLRQNNLTGISDADINWTSVTAASFVFVTNENATNDIYEGYLFLLDSNGEVTTYTSEDIPAQRGYNAGEFTSININADYVTSAQVFATNLSEADALILGKAMLPEVDSNIPEPTTATLSLLALAGLAARRRR